MDWQGILLLNPTGTTAETKIIYTSDTTTATNTNNFNTIINTNYTIDPVTATNTTNTSNNTNTTNTINTYAANITINTKYCRWVTEQPWVVIAS